MRCTAYFSTFVLVTSYSKKSHLRWYFAETMHCHTRNVTIHAENTALDIGILFLHTSVFLFFLDKYICQLSLVRQNCHSFDYFGGSHFKIATAWPDCFLSIKIDRKNISKLSKGHQQRDTELFLTFPGMKRQLALFWLEPTPTQRSHRCTTKHPDRKQKPEECKIKTLFQKE